MARSLLFPQVMDSVGVLNDIAQRLDDKGCSDLWTTLRTPRLTHTRTNTHADTHSDLKEGDEACLYL